MNFGYAQMVPIATNFGTPGLPRFMEQLRAHHQVVVEELTGPLAVRADAADDGGEVNDEGRLRIAIYADHLLPVRAGRNRCAVARDVAAHCFSRSFRTMWLPRKPVPPVTNTRCGCQKLIREGRDSIC